MMAPRQLMRLARRFFMSATFKGHFAELNLWKSCFNLFTAVLQWA
jgi:hypothetical protein